MKVYRYVFFVELDFMDVIYELFKFKFFLKGVIDFVCKVFSCYEKVDIILIFVENGSFEVVDDFCFVLEYFGYCDIIELIDFFNIYIKVGKIIIE